MSKKKTVPVLKPIHPAVLFKEIGSGITKRSVPTFPGLSLTEIVDVLHSMAPLPDTMDFAVTVAAHFLDAHGIEYRPDGAYRTADGRKQGLVCYVKTIGHRAYESPVWYAASIFQSWFLMVDSILEGNAKSAASSGFEIGLLFAEANAKFKWEHTVLAHQRSRKGAAVGGTKRGKQQRATRKPEWAKWQAAANKIWKIHPTWGKPAVAAMVQKQFPNAKVRTIRLRISKPAT